MRSVGKIESKATFLRGVFFNSNEKVLSIILGKCGETKST